MKKLIEVIRRRSIAQDYGAKSKVQGWGDGRVEDWKGGRLEEWKDGRVEDGITAKGLERMTQVVRPGDPVRHGMCLKGRQRYVSIFRWPKYSDGRERIRPCLSGRISMGIFPRREALGYGL
jgi:hypothetical protein